MKEQVQAASERMSERKALAVRAQQERMEQLKQRCAKLIAICRGHVEAAGSL